PWKIRYNKRSSTPVLNGHLQASTFSKGDAADILLDTCADARREFTRNIRERHIDRLQDQNNLRCGSLISFLDPGFEL
ncbi:MAG TPA: hypothetical protein PLK94_06230, partial [Alphaproteobacteria bacterium]|nr:hypothetical protein [Alphaproteobacteria bacterium]